ncbi:MAG: SLC13 family permease, partial [Candidatus Hydrogenedentes bacterium]|nr:SLC13 family permease [Candidatus Hydrogenedentota bacterium]
MALTWEGWITLGVILSVFVVLVRNWAPPDMVMLSAAIFLGVTGVLEVDQVFAGLVNPGVLAIGALFIVAAAMRETGVIDMLGARLLGSARTEGAALIRLAVTVVPLSAFLNNTPVVAMLVPMLSNWSRKHRVAPSKLLIPLSYMAILGGTCTLIGTSTTIVVRGLMKEAVAGEGGAALSQTLYPISMFEISKLGVPFALIGVVYLLTIGRKLLPERCDMLDQGGEGSRDYLIDMRLEPECRLVGETVEGAGLRHLQGLFLVEIVRDGACITPVRPDEILHADDVLTFTGVLSTIVDLERIPGLVPVADGGYEASASRARGKALSEAVISDRSPVIGKTVRDAEFRALYNAAIVAVHRGGQRLKNRVGDIVLQSGDTLLLQADPHFKRAHRHSPDFFLVGGVEEARAVRTDRALISLGLLVLLIGLMSFGDSIGNGLGRVINSALGADIHIEISVALAAALVAVLMVGTRCISPAIAREALDLRTLLTIGAAIALGTALDQTGAAKSLVAQLPIESPFVMLAVIYIVTSILTECVTTKGSAVIMFHIGLATAAQLQVDPRPFVIAVIFAAAASFVTPLGYQTNLMVYGPGGYRFSDYL